MALPSRMYGDPARYVEHNEWVTISCGGCLSHALNKDKTAYECKMKQPDYPTADNKTCTFFKRKTQYESRPRSDTGS